MNSRCITSDPPSLAGEFARLVKQRFNEPNLTGVVELRSLVGTWKNKPKAKDDQALEGSTTHRSL